MKPTYYRRDDCRLCKSTQLDLVLPLAPTPVGDAYVSGDQLQEEQVLYPLDLFLCKQCGLAQLRDVIDPDILYGDFIYETAISLGLVEHFKNYASEVLDFLNPEQDSLVIDIGSNDGSLLGFFKAQGMRVLGVEPAPAIAEKALSRGIPTVSNFFTAELGRQLNQEYGPAAIVTTNNTFANVDDLDDMMIGIRSLMAADGVFVMETGYVSDTVSNRLFDTIYHEHLSYFAVKPLQQFFKKHGMALIDAKPIGTKGGSFRVMAQLLGGPHTVSSSVNDMVEREIGSDILNAAPFMALDADMTRARTRIVNCLDEIYAQGKTVAGYGASVGTTTFLYYIKSVSPLIFIVDDNPAKYNLFSPGLHIPVLSSSALVEKRPDYVIILAWRYADAIIKKNQAYLDGGGKFIIPWPELQIV